MMSEFNRVIVSSCSAITKCFALLRNFYFISFAYATKREVFHDFIYIIVIYVVEFYCILQSNSPLTFLEDFAWVVGTRVVAAWVIGALGKRKDGGVRVTSFSVRILHFIKYGIIFGYFVEQIPWICTSGSKFLWWAFVLFN